MSEIKNFLFHDRLVIVSPVSDICQKYFSILYTVIYTWPGREIFELLMTADLVHYVEK